MIERIVHGSNPHIDSPITVSNGPDRLANPDAVCIEMPSIEAYMYISKQQWRELNRAVEQWFADAEQELNSI